MSYRTERPEKRSYQRGYNAGKKLADRDQANLLNHVKQKDAEIAALRAEATRLREALGPIPDVLSALLAWGMVRGGADDSFWRPRCEELREMIRAALEGEKP